MTDATVFRVGKAVEQLLPWSYDIPSLDLPDSLDANDVEQQS